MQTKIHPDLVGKPRIDEADEILRACVHCGFCTAVCPTYQLLGDELDGPRGRIYLIKNLLETGTMSGPATHHIDRCLTCRACETACPSGVQYGHLLDIGKSLMGERASRGLFARLKSAVLRAVIPRTVLFSVLLRTGQFVRFALPQAIRQLIPARQPARDYPPVRSTPTVKRVLVLQGCVQRAATPNVNHALEFLLSQHGTEVVYLPEEGCCGALDYHLGAHEAGLARMRTQIDRIEALLPSVDVIVSTASGCGVTIKDYPAALSGDASFSARARALAVKVVDASELLAPLSFNCAPRIVAFQSPCTLQHGQKLGGVVESILSRAGFHLVPVADGHLCCGSAGTYSIMQPAMSARLKANKLAALTAAAPEVIATANVGCQVHLASASEVPVVHWIELMADNVRLGQQPPE